MQLSRKIQPAAAEEDKTSSTFEHKHIFHLYVTLWVLCRSLTETHAAAPCPTTWQRFIAWPIWSQCSFTSLWALSFGRVLEYSFVAEPCSFILKLLSGTWRQAQKRPLTKPITEGLCLNVTRFDEKWMKNLPHGWKNVPLYTRSDAV